MCIMIKTRVFEYSDVKGAWSDEKTAFLNQVGRDNIIAINDVSLGKTGMTIIYYWDEETDVEKWIPEV